MSRHRKRLQAPPTAVQGEQDASGPTPEFLRHHDARKPEIGRTRFQEAWSVRSRFLALAPDDQTVIAATRWRDDFDIAQGVQEGRSLERVDQSNSGTDGIGTAQIDAENRLRNVRDDIGRTYSLLLLWCLVVDQEWQISAVKLGCESRYAKTLTEQALAALVKHYQIVDNLRRVT